MITQLPGFSDPVQDAQITFRSLLNALAHPGQSYPIAATIIPPTGLNLSCAAACLSLFDIDTLIWLQPGLPPEAEAWLRFHTGCRFTSYPDQAQFAVIWQVDLLPDLSTFHWGTAEYPESSTTLLIQIGDQVGERVTVQGAGILGERSIAPALPAQFWKQWQMNTQAYPLGIDVFLCSATEVMGLPRTTNIQSRISR
ncbi:MAG TPA: phosphonate C-P lyase system protein PhnH [Trichocoleus sp.]|jgi:alpha-D-ribose 1-methylphosphonate 5-triphosphate synthase subunit PhnH